MKELTFSIRGLDCPNCAAKLERAIGQQEGVQEAVLDFAQESLRIVCAKTMDEEALRRALQQTADRVEEGVTILREGEGHVGRQTEEQHGEHGHTHDGKAAGETKERILLIGAFLLFLLALALPKEVQPVCCVLSWLLAGHRVTVSAGRTLIRFLRSIFRGSLVNPLDENLLMTIATIGACVLGEYAEGAMVMLLFNLGEQLQDSAVRKSRTSIEKLMAVRPDHANLLSENGVQRVSPDTVLAGDLIELRPGERVPLDGIVAEGTGALDTRDMTGESMPREVGPGDEVLSGCINLQSRLVLRVTRPTEESAVSRMLQRIRDAAKGRAQTELFFTRFARVYTPIVVGAALLLVVVPLFFGGEVKLWAYRALSFLVVSCPCALVLSIPLSFFCGIGGAGRRGVLCKGGAALEQLSGISAVAFDKTGTLTKGELKVERTEPADGIAEEELLRAAASAESYSTHPIAAALQNAAEAEAVEQLRELPGRGVACLYRKKTLLVGNRRLLEEEGVQAPPLDETGVLLAHDGKYIGRIDFSDTLHPQAKDTVEALRAREIRDIVMLSGDNRRIAQRIGEELGGIQVHAELLPDEKVDRLKKIGGSAAYVGDGVNDAPCLLAADVGIAVGLSGSDAAIEAADIVLLGGSPMGVVDALDIAGKTMRNVRQNAGFALSVKGAFLLLSALGLCPMWLAVFADAGVAVLCVLNALRLLAGKKG